ncbi:hypothetical protein R1flu_019280 [Riccia fluitans]|uniref:QWRF motif-containing protein 2 n=1 Tax=Riccia fluitans TaxID=41844 RepID=A0ABD1ZI72_9MARC
MVAADSSPTTPASSLRVDCQEPHEKAATENGNGRTPLAAASDKISSNGAVQRKPKNREVTSRYKAANSSSATPSTAAAQAAAATSRRHPSPNIGRSTSGDPPLPKRSISAERRRPWPSVGSSTAPEAKPVSPPTTGPAEGIWHGVKPRTTSRPEGLWPSSLQSKIPEGPSPNGSVNGNMETRSDPGGEPRSSPPDHTLKPTANGIHRPSDSGGGPPLRKGSPMRRQSTEQTENSRPNDHLRSKPDLQRWPGSSNGKVLGAAALTRSMDLSVERDRSLSNRSNVSASQSRPGSSAGIRSVRASPASVISSFTRSFTRSINEVPISSASRPSSRNNTPERSGRGRAAALPPPSVTVQTSVGKSAGKESSNSLAENGNSGESTSHVRQSSQETVLASSDTHSAFGENASDSESVSSGGSGTTGSRTSSSTRGTTVAARVWATSERSRRLSEGMRSSMSEQDLSAAMKQAGRRKVPTLGPLLGANSLNSAWSLSPGRGIAPISSTPQPPDSPTPRGGRGGSSPLRALPSPTRSRPPIANGSISRTISSAISSGQELRLRGKKAMTQQEEALDLRIYQNRFLQLRFINAKAEAALSSQMAAAEKSLYSVWLKTCDLRSSVAQRRIELQLAKRRHKLRTILSNQAACLQEWTSLRQTHSAALSGVIGALEASILRVPVTGGARADVQAVKEALGSAVDVMNAVELSVNALLPKAQSMDGLVAQLAETAAQERALLAECGDFLSTAAALEIEERSLSAHLVQLQQEKNRLLGTTMDNVMATSDLVRLSTP